MTVALVQGAAMGGGAGLVSDLRQRLGSEQLLHCDGETLRLDSGLVDLDKAV